MKTKKRQNVGVTELSPNERFPKNCLKSLFRPEPLQKNTEANLDMLGDVRCCCMESKDLDSNVLTLKRPFPYIAEPSTIQGIGTLNGH